MKKSIYGDTFMYVCQLVHPATGEVLVNIPELKEVLDNRIGHGLVRYAYIVHDCDKITEDDIKERDAIREQYLTTLMSLVKHDDLQSTVADSELLAAVDKLYPRFQLGQVKPRHIHVVIRLASRRYLSEVTSWFVGVCNNSPFLFKRYTDVRGQSRRELNALRYLIHAAHPAKYQYDSSAVVASFDYASEITAISLLAKEREKYDMRSEDIMDYMNEIVAGKKTRADYIREHSYAMYVKDMKKIDAAELQRIKTRPSHMRCCGYIGSSAKDVGGLGKSSLGRLLGICFAIKQYGLNLDEWSSFESLKTSNAYIHSASSAGIFEMYDSQPILCASDFTADTVKASFRDGLAALKDFCDPHPTPAVRHVKGSVIVPACDYVIIDGQQDWYSFFRDICRTQSMSEEDAKKQVSQLARRWMWYIDVSSVGNLSLWLNKEYYDTGVPGASQMVEYAHVAFDYISVLNCDLPAHDVLKSLVEGIMPVAEMILSYHDSKVPYGSIPSPVITVRSNNTFKKLKENLN